MTASEAQQLKALEAENVKLMKLLAESPLDNAALEDVLVRKWKFRRTNEAPGRISCIYTV
ncbi:hypothetical protein J2798_003959 [Herbaspirillum seropedicae]|nr:hypothetical protein [Herbaspirillum seropedicae]